MSRKRNLVIYQGERWEEGGKEEEKKSGDFLRTIKHLTLKNSYLSYLETENSSVLSLFLYK